MKVYVAFTQVTEDSCGVEPQECAVFDSYDKALSHVINRLRVLHKDDTDLNEIIDYANERIRQYGGYIEDDIEFYIKGCEVN